MAAVLAAFLAVMTFAGPATANSGINSRTNEWRRDQGLHRIAVTDKMEYRARVRVRQLRQVWGHQFGWTDRTGCSGPFAENIAYLSIIPDQPAQWFFNAWRLSRPHRLNMRGDWEVMGSAIFKDNGQMWGVQLFAAGC